MSGQEDRDERRIAENHLLDKMDEIRAKRNAVPEEAAALARMVDFKIPAWGVIVSIIAGLGVLTSMYYKLEKVAENLTDLQITVRAGNSQAVSIASELILLKYRIDNIENARARENREPLTRR